MSEHGHGGFEQQARDQMSALAAQRLTGPDVDHWFLLGSHKIPMYGDGRGGLTIYGLFAWEDCPERRLAVERLIDFIKGLATGGAVGLLDGLHHAAPLPAEPVVSDIPQVEFEGSEPACRHGHQRGDCPVPYCKE